MFIFAKNRNIMGKKTHLEEIERLIGNIHDRELIVDYSDEDILFIDTVKNLVNPETFKLNLNILVYCNKGRLQADVNGTPFELTEGHLFIALPNENITNFMISPDFDCSALCITNKGIHDIFRSFEHVWTQAMYINKLRLVRLNDENREFYSKYYELIKLCLNSQDEDILRPYKREIVKALIRSGLLGLCNILSAGLPAEAENAKQPSTLFQRFLDLLQNSDHKHLSVDELAAKLCVTPKYLTELCKKNSGKTAYEWITEYTLSDIGYYLESTNYSIKGVANLTGFSNSSFFGKYVKEHFGMSPKQYRQNLRQSKTGETTS